MLLPVDPENPEPETIARAAALLRDGEVIAGPSDTVYGLLAAAGNPRALETLRRWKGRTGPFLHLVAGWEEARSLAPRVPDAVWNRLSLIWPGPVTVILPAGLEGGGVETVALRMPDSSLLRALARAAGGPLLSTSANPAGTPAPTRADQVLRAFPEGLPLVLDGGEARSSEPSTLVDLTTDPPRVIRRGCGDPRPLLDPRPSPP